MLSGSVFTMVKIISKFANCHLLWRPSANKLIQLPQENIFDMVECHNCICNTYSMLALMLLTVFILIVALNQFHMKAAESCQFLGLEI